MDMEALTRLLYGLNSYPLTPYNVLLRYFLIAKISNRIYFDRSAWHTPKHLKKSVRVIRVAGKKAFFIANARYACQAFQKRRRNMKKFGILITIMCFFACPACQEDFGVNDVYQVCEGITCGKHGTCIPTSAISAVCLCDEGYHHPDDRTPLDCVLQATACADVTCGGFGICVVTGSDVPLCLCNEGYEQAKDEPLRCVVATAPCDGITCSGHGTCHVDADGKAVCQCDFGYSNTDAASCNATADDRNGNYMLDIYETASDQGTDCVTIRHAGCSSAFCDSFINHKCSTRCTDDTQCISDQYFCRSDGRCAPKVFETVWHVAKAETTLQFPGGKPASEGDVCRYSIDWGDGSTEDFYQCQDFVPHLYAKEGDYNIKVTGHLPGWTCYLSDEARSCDGDAALTAVLSFGPVELAKQAFYKATALTHVSEIDIPNATNLTNISSFFHYDNVFDSDLNRWDTSNVTDMSYAFKEAKRFNGKISQWDTSNVTTMTGMFENAFSFMGDISAWDTSNVTAMNWMFKYAVRFNGDLSRWNTSNVTNMREMFRLARMFNGDLSRWDTSNVTLMNQMFEDASSFNGSIGHWNTAKVTNMANMFLRASSFNQFIGNWNTANVTNMSSMFNGAKNFDQYIGDWNTAKVTNMSYMFSEAIAFNQNISNWNTANVTNMQAMFRTAISFNSGIGKWNTAKVTTMRDMFYHARLFNQQLEWDVSNVTDMAGMFREAYAMSGCLNWSKDYDVKKVTTMAYMFHGATVFEGCGVNLWKTSEALKDLNRTFESTPAFNRNLQNWIVTSVANTEAGGNYTATFKGSGLSTANYNNMVNNNAGWAAMNKGTLGLP